MFVCKTNIQTHKCLKPEVCFCLQRMCVSTDCTYLPYTVLHACKCLHHNFKDDYGNGGKKVYVGVWGWMSAVSRAPQGWVWLRATNRSRKREKKGKRVNSSLCPQWKKKRELLGMFTCHCSPSVWLIRLMCLWTSVHVPPCGFLH